MIRLPFAEALTNDGTDYHGGVIAAVIDTAGAAAACSNHDFERGVRVALIEIPWRCSIRVEELAA